MRILPIVGLIASLFFSNSMFLEDMSAARATEANCCIAMPPYRAGCSLDVLVDGVPLPQISHGGKTYVEAPWNRDFELRISCPSYARYLAICSVDGLSVLNGRPASSRDRGYVIENGSVTIPGFRLDRDNVAHFHFGDKSASYANLIGQPRNVGVIGVKLYADADYHVYRPPYPYWYPYGYYSPYSYRQDESGTYAPNSGGGGLPKASMGEFLSRRGEAQVIAPPYPWSSHLDHDMGTVFGSRTNFNTSETYFNRGALVASFNLEYASHEKLVRAGILPYGGVIGAPTPDPFPADGCSPPPGWQG
ncbi:MAG: hypothetical protein C5B53_00505 [Candidatus Melainabacteria bacterium]|nr:MAG: hypothetical protein C5B53_00505 [Candidatus Melainabacteria bacterium]